MAAFPIVLSSWMDLWNEYFFERLIKTDGVVPTLAARGSVYPLLYLKAKMCYLSENADYGIHFPF